MQIVSTKICKVSDIGIHNNLFDCTMLSWMDESGRAIAAELAYSPNIITLIIGESGISKAISKSEIVL
jgi:acyl-CoA hydrolase